MVDSSSGQNRYTWEVAQQWETFEVFAFIMVASCLYIQTGAVLVDMMGAHD